QILPPRGSWGRGEVIDWQRFLEDWLVSYLKYLRKIAGELGVPVPLAINESATYLSPAHPGMQSQVADVYGFDFFAKSTGSPATGDSPFHSSQAPAFFGAYATPERPTACLKLGLGWRDERAPIANEATVQAMLGCAAHNTRGYSLYLVHDGKSPEGERSALDTLLDEEGREQPSYEAVRGVQDFLARYEPMLLQSIETHDSIAYLHYQPYSRLTIDEYSARRGAPEPAPFLAWRGSSGFYDLLVSAGYQPRFLDLEQATDAQLAARRVAILPTKQYLDEASLAKLRRYVEQGGQLITLPGPIRQDAYGRPLPDAEMLYPYAEQSAQWLRGRQKTPGLLSGLVLRRLLRRGRQEQALPEPMRVSDLVEWLAVGQVVNPPAARLISAGGAAVRGDYRLICFGAEGQMPADQIILRAGAEVAGYCVPVGQGTSTVLGTLPGGAYATSLYARLAPEERGGLRRFAVELLDAAGVQRQVVSDLELETARRSLPDGSWLLFLLNRLGEQRGEVKLALEGLTALRVETLYRSKDSSAEVSGPASLSLRLAADAVLALHVLPA
ncbi:MAG TPA: hypothetical protein VH590_06565, partial [Ktedonobacterales bacterium]